MIVIVIVGVLYTLVIAKIHTADTPTMTPTLTNLKEYLTSFLQDDAKKAELICLNDCKECAVYVDNTRVKTIKSFFDASIQAYSYDFLWGTKEKEQDVFFDKENVEQNVCFSFYVKRNTIAEQVFVAYKNRVYDYTPYFTQTAIYDSLSEATTAHRELAQKVMQ